MVDLACSASRLLDKLQELQYGENVPVLLFSQDSTGLGSQISRRIAGLKLALMFNRKVVFPHLSEPPYGQVFKPLHSEIDYNAAAGEAADFFSDNSSSAKMVRLDFWNWLKHTQHINHVYAYVPEELQGTCDPKLFYEGLLLSFCHLTDEHAQLVDNEAARLKVGDNTVGVHIRRGDKSNETPFVPIEAINANIARVSANDKFKRLFVSSDSPEVFREIAVPMGKELVYDETEQRFNNANHRLLLKRPELSQQETQTAVKNIFLLGKCGAIVGQTNAHFSSLAAAQIVYRNGGREFGTLIPGDYVMQRSATARLLQVFKNEIRATARFALPWLTLRHSKRKRR